MRHNKKGRKLGTDWSHTKAMKRSLVKALFLNDRIKTVESRAKEIRPDVDKIITWAKKGDLHSRRLAIAALGNDKELVREIFEKVADIASDVLGINADEITEETTFDDLDADSLDRLQLVTAFEDEFDIEMDEERLLAISSVADAIDAIEATQEA